MTDIITDVEELSVYSREVDVAKEGKLVQSVIVKLKEAIREKNLVSLSAVQIGEPIRVFVINFNGKLRSFVNPIIGNSKGLELATEECPSLPGKKYIRPRNNDIAVMYSTPLGKVESKRLVGLAAIVFQHEIDHLNGLLLSDIGLEVDDDFFAATEEERFEVLSAYCDSLDLRGKEAEEAARADEEASKIMDVLDTMEKIRDGDIEISPIKKEDN